MQLGQRRVAVTVRQSVELEPDVGKRLGGAVVQVARDAGPFRLGTERAEPTEPARVVDGQRERRRNPARTARRRRWRSDPARGVRPRRARPHDRGCASPRSCRYSRTRRSTAPAGNRCSRPAPRRACRAPREYACGSSSVSRCSGIDAPSASWVRHDALVSSAKRTTSTSGSNTSRNVSRRRSHDLGEVERIGEGAHDVVQRVEQVVRQRHAGDFVGALPFSLLGLQPELAGVPADDRGGDDHDRRRAGRCAARPDWPRRSRRPSGWCPR